MRLFEYEGKKLLSSGGLHVPRSQLLKKKDASCDVADRVVCKAQTLSGDRMKAGNVVFATGKDELTKAIEALFKKQQNNSSFSSLLVEERIDFESPEYYVSFVADAWTRKVQFTFSSQGGTGIEGRAATTLPLDINHPQFPQLDIPEHVVRTLYDIFRLNDCTLLEVNPLVLKKGAGDWIVLDVKIVLDDAALPRHPELSFIEEERKSRAEEAEGTQKAKAIDASDHRGTAGSTYVELDGDIGMFPSGGGASLTAMDALLRFGGKPANYTEYSGNPTGEKVAKLTNIVASNPNLSAIWVVGAVANFTDIHETLSGFIKGLRKTRKDLGLAIDYPIVIRRGGPRDEEAYVMLHQVSDFHLVVTGEETSIEDSAKQIIRLANEYRYQKTHS